jgi:hypothetical protein
MAGKSDLLDLTMQLHHATERAVLVSDDGERKNAVWLSLAHCEVERKANGLVVVTLPEWLALDKGLI